MVGIFAIALHPFKQLYMIRIPFRDVSITPVYALLPNKNHDTYTDLFQALVDRCQARQYQMAVQTVVTDFEDNVLRAVTAVFGRQTDHQGCFYHFTPATWKKIQHLVLVPLYRQNDNFKGHHSYHDTCHARCGIDIMWVFWKPSIPDYYQNTITINTYDFSTPYPEKNPTSLLLQKTRYT